MIPYSLAMQPYLIEPHVHLYGCLDPADILALAKDRWKSRADALAIYLKRYRDVFGQSFEATELFEGADALKNITSLFVAKKIDGFQQFQTKFDFLVTLFPFDLNDLSVHEYVVKKYAKLGFHYVEFKVFIPPYIPDSEFGPFMNRLCEVFDQNQSISYIPRLQITLLRERKGFESGLFKLKSWLKSQPKNQHIVKGFDLCMDEQADPVFDKVALFEQVQAMQHPSLGMYIHVGECFDRIKLVPSLLRAAFTIEKGAQRIGHGLCIGHDIDQNTELFATSDQLKEIEYFQASTHKSEICQHIAKLAKSIFDQKNPVVFARELQKLVGELAIEHQVPIEVCPTSNLIISNIPELDTHPVHNMVARNLPLVIGSDDPGIFGTNLKKEWQLLENYIGPQPLKRIRQQQLALAVNP